MKLRKVSMFKIRLSRTVALLTILVLPLVTATQGLQVVSASASPATLTAVPHSTLPGWLLHRAVRISAAKPVSQLNLSFGLPFRNQAALNAFDKHLTSERPLTSREFD